MNGHSQIFFDDAQALADTLAAEIAADLKKDIEERGQGLLILPGGSSPRLLMRALARLEIEWDKIVVTTTDERFVPFESEDCNARQVSRLLGIDAVWLADGGFDTGTLPWPASVTVLGMGMDAHIASLFPGAAIDMDAEGIVPGFAPAPPRERLSLAFRTLLNTKRLVLLVTDADKRALCERILQGEEQDTPLAKLVKTAESRLSLYIVK